MSKGVDISSLHKEKGKYRYRGRLWELNQPIPSTNKQKKMMVLATKIIGGKKHVKIVHFGAKGYGHNYSKEAKKNYLKRSANIRNKEGQLTKNDTWSANYWARKVLWPKNQPANGPHPRKKAA